MQQRPNQFLGSQGQSDMANDGGVFSSNMHGSSAGPSYSTMPTNMHGQHMMQQPQQQPRQPQQQQSGQQSGQQPHSGYIGNTVSQNPNAYNYVDSHSGDIQPTHNYQNYNNEGMQNREGARGTWGGQQTYGDMGNMQPQQIMQNQNRPAGGSQQMESPILTCRACNLRFMNPTTFRQHECRGFVVSPREYKKPCICTLCNAELKNEQNLKRHIKVVHDSKAQYVCPQCTGSFASRGSLKIHQQTVHRLFDRSQQNMSPQKSTPKGVTKTYSCPLCPDTFRWKGNLKRHRQLVHEKIKPFTCHICKAKFGTKSNMRVHAIVHER